MLFYGAANPTRLEASEGDWWPGSIETALNQAGTNRVEILRTLQQAPERHRPAVQFLIENMPASDLQTLTTGFLLENVALAYQALTEAPWAGKISPELFLNEVLPYACLNERRDDWRARLRQICLPIIRGCETPAQAALQLNRELFRVLKVKYSTKRRRPDQSPIETMESGMATCTGLSILLVDACRSVGIPARVVGTPLWSNHSGNHTWVEIWDETWHFTGAAEASGSGLNHGWFVHNASLAVKDDPDHAIYASSFRKTGLSFPLVWARTVSHVSAVNVTERYAAATPRPGPITPRVLVNVFDRPGGRRVSANVTATEVTNSAAVFRGRSKGDTADMNDLLVFDLLPDREYVIQVQHEKGQWVQRITTGASERSVVFYLSERSSSQPASAGAVPSPSSSPPQSQ